MHWLVFSDVKTLINLLVLLISDAAQEKETLTEAGTCLTALLVSAGLESEWNSTEDLGVSYKLLNPDRVFFSTQWARAHLKHLPMLNVRLLACLPSYKHSLLGCISPRPLLNEHWDKAGSEWTVWLHRREAWAPQSNVPLKYLSAL